MAGARAAPKEAALNIVFAFPFSYQHQERRLRRALQLKLAAKYNGQPANKPDGITWGVWRWASERLGRELGVTVRADQTAGQIRVEAAGG